MILVERIIRTCYLVAALCLCGAASIFSQTLLPALNSDDGTEVNASVWLEDGYEDSHNFLGRDGLTRYEAGFRFPADALEAGDELTFARLRFPSFGSRIDSCATLTIEGVLQKSPATFSQDQRPSMQMPRTRNRVHWKIGDNWDAGTAKIPCYYASPNIAAIVNEIIALPGWGEGAEGKRIALIVRDASSSFETNLVIYDDLESAAAFTTPVQLEVFEDVYDTFLGPEHLGRITDRSVTVHLHALIDVDVFIEYGTEAGSYPFQTRAYLDCPAEAPIEIPLHSLQPDRRYHYRLAHREAGTETFEKGPERSFHTQRPRGPPFVFTVVADEHLQCMLRHPQKPGAMELYRIALKNIAGDEPDFLISLGDFAHTEYLSGRNAKNLAEATECYLEQRSFLSEVTHSVPFFLAIGNHEGEQGWHYYKQRDLEGNLATWSTLARKAVIPHPDRGGFYRISNEYMPDLIARESYFAWEWGDALFVVLEPYWNTMNKPSKSLDGWDWTLGREQYDWLHETLHDSRARWKLIFIHHLTSTKIFGMNPQFSHYGRGGIEVAKHKVAGLPSFEWGGEDKFGNDIFAQRRPGWAHGPVHDLLVAQNATIVFHGHDHFFAKQDLDGLVYLECPQPGDTSYAMGFRKEGGYQHGDFFPNSGHVRVFVNPDHLTVDYIRAFLPGDGENGEKAYSFIID
jgi:hypothetical protein